ncbi:hypothetical protein GCM10010531_22620 [Blastococcus jejuensis]|uniref:Uncharacterized protein n=1 Tax=Blastococcus jejuensis TaxID=351224 RepID=A0ABP6P6F8_9ACTN
MEQVRVCIGDDEILVSWHPPDRPPDGRRHGAEGTCVPDSGEGIIVSRDGQCRKVPAGRIETQSEAPVALSGPLRDSPQGHLVSCAGVGST